MWRYLGFCLSLTACLESGGSAPDAIDAAIEAGSFLDASASGPRPSGDGAPHSSDGEPVTTSSDASVSTRPAGDASAAPADASTPQMATPAPRSTLPVPPGPADKPQPDGTSANLTVLSWAGFQGAASYTFDDGQPSHLEHWPEIKATKAPVTYYITTAYRDLSKGFDSTWQDVVASGSEVGNHTVNHCYYSGRSCGVDGKKILSPKSKELDDANAYIVETAGQSDVWTAATPFGDSEWTAETKSRFMLTRGTIAGVGGDGMVAPLDGNDPQNLPGVMVQEGQGASAFNKTLDAARSKKKWAILVFHSIGPTKSAWFATVDIAAITDSIAHARQLADLWLDSVAHVGAYWVAEKILGATQPKPQGSEQRWTWQVPAHFPKGRFLRVRVDGGTLRQNGKPLTWDPHGYYEVAFDVGALSWSP